ncbi:mitoguardin 2-like [Rhopilema esculentum]|uniref:mitoguardin 2-like n=1 Tax=Rhopilema esculentum TaxID=499914 RepID=UPI0031D134AA|eukprot:gene10611-19351_t
MTGWFGATIVRPGNLNATIFVAVSVFGVVSVAYLVIANKKEESRRRRKQKHADAIEAEIFSQLSKGKPEFEVETDDVIIFDTNVLENLVVTLEKLDDVLNSIKENESWEVDRVQRIKKVVAVLELILKEECILSNTTKEEFARKRRVPVVRHAEQKLSVSCSQKDFTDAGNEDEVSSCSDESFVSAAESVPDEEQLEKLILCDQESQALLLQYGHIEFYNEGIESYNNVGVKVRKKRTELLGCENDADFSIKVYCIRRAFEVIFENTETREWFLEIGRKMLIQFLTVAGKDLTSFEGEFDSLVFYCQDLQNWLEIEEELKGRGVCCMSFYDIVLDFIIMDSFDDLEEPPYALTSVIQNGWLSNSIKETALATSVWSLLTAKTRMLQSTNGFMARFYRLSQHLTPVLVWGFLGPDGSLKDKCHSFKEMLLGFLRDIFSLDRCSYDTVNTLANGIIRSAKSRASSSDTLNKGI